VQIWCKLKNNRFFKAYNAVSCYTPFCVLVLEHFPLPFNLQATKIEMLRADSTHFFLFDGCSTFFSDNSISGKITKNILSFASYPFLNPSTLQIDKSVL